MKELLQNLLEDKDIFKPHGEEGIERLKQSFAFKSPDEQNQFLYDRFYDMNDDMLMRAALKIYGSSNLIDLILKHVDTGRLKKETVYSIILDLTL